MQGLGGHAERPALREAKTDRPPGEGTVRFAFQKRTTLQESDAGDGGDNGGGREAPAALAVTGTELWAGGVPRRSLLCGRTGGPS